MKGKNHGTEVIETMEDWKTHLYRIKTHRLLIYTRVFKDILKIFYKRLRVLEMTRSEKNIAF